MDSIWNETIAIELKWFAVLFGLAAVGFWAIGYWAISYFSNQHYHRENIEATLEEIRDLLDEKK